jgi:hypothetical protein
MKLAGDEYFQNGDFQMASESWCKGLLKIRRVNAGVEGRRLRKVGDVAFTNRVDQLTFELNSSRTLNTLEPMRDNKEDPCLVQALADNVFHATEAARDAIRTPDATWEPSPRRMAKLLYREAIARRYIGDRSPAEEAIDNALRECLMIQSLKMRNREYCKVEDDKPIERAGAGMKKRIHFEKSMPLSCPCATLCIKKLLPALHRIFINQYIPLFHPSHDESYPKVSSKTLIDKIRINNPIAATITRVTPTQPSAIAAGPTRPFTVP